ncbi:hypothetical protein E3T28_03130 [Cryobacterium sinapicolor]|uniref:Asp23/Gls24 family envelope stress response protein n=1 Tax=Cryobacterium sinapicolor TaxID=1259236 RepID=A0ABY2JEN1_9MICO|nr:MULTISPECIES: hypothetical protein [Cryobacterium]TFC93522.1 hypothetical protein E3O67_01425 [Cryobacterium sp. TMT3-29-2]TFD04013.1 hypothetical protein E3T28_03130 [Cryobacterium sinapicolor]
MSDAPAPEKVTPDPAPESPLPRQLDELVLAVPGVDALYSAAPLVATVVASVVASAVEAVTGQPKSNSSVSVSEKKTGLEIAVKIGVTAPYAAIDVSRRVHDAITEQLDQNGSPAATEIAVTVARID